MISRSSHAARYGFSAEARRIAMGFEAAMTVRGWSRTEIEKALNWYASFGKKCQPEEFFEAFQRFAHGAGLSDEKVFSAVAWRDLVAERGADAIPIAPPPPREDMEKRLAEIRALRRNDPTGYEADKDVQWLEMDLLGLLSDSASPATDSATQKTETAAQPAEKSRLETIREMRRADPVAYDRSPEIQSEELKLIAAGLPQPSQTAPADSGSTGNQTS